MYIVCMPSLRPLSFYRFFCLSPLFFSVRITQVFAYQNCCIKWIYIRAYKLSQLDQECMKSRIVCYAKYKKIYTLGTSCCCIIPVQTWLISPIRYNRLSVSISFLKYKSVHVRIYQQQLLSFFLPVVVSISVAAIVRIT